VTVPLPDTPIRPAPPMVGHSGASGAVLFHVPTLDLSVSGTVNQVRSRSLSYRLLTRLVMSCDGAWRGGR
jgi:D-alanyl-D-alanine carboxypeptidase